MSLLLSFATLGNGNLEAGSAPTQDREFEYENVFCNWLCTPKPKDIVISILCGWKLSIQPSLVRVGDR